MKYAIFLIIMHIKFIIVRLPCFEESLTSLYLCYTFSRFLLVIEINTTYFGVI